MARRGVLLLGTVWPAARSTQRRCCPSQQALTCVLVAVFSINAKGVYRAWVATPASSIRLRHSAARGICCRKAANMWVR